MSNKIPVSDFNVTDSYSISYIEIIVVNIDLYTSATICVSCYIDSGLMVKRYNFTLKGDDYNNWGSNDDYIVNYVKTQLNVSKSI
jgi:hypothetical protein